jgi:phospholipid/cholesterol/gamma-HCH transport system permease protein
VSLAKDFFGMLAELIRKWGRFSWFAIRLMAVTPRALRKPRWIIEQIHNTGARSLVIIMLSGLFVGMVLGLQGYDLLRRFGSTEALGTAAALGLLRELGPVVTALLFAGRAGTALTSEIGLMSATDQLAAMEMMAVDPVRRVLAPRVLGGIVSMPLLAAIFALLGIFGAYLVGVVMMGVNAGQFWSQMRASVELHDVTEGVMKSIAFGVACSAIAVFEGYHAVPTAEGVGQATTRTVVVSSVAVLVLDYMLTAALL